MSSSQYRFSQLRAGKCGLSEAAAISALYSDFNYGSGYQKLSIADIKLVCRHNHVIIVRDSHGQEQPIVGMLALAVSHLLDGPIGKVEHPMIRRGFEILSVPLFAEAIKHLKRQGVEKVEVIHRVRGVAWPHRAALQELGLGLIGAHVLRVNLSA